LGRLEGNRGRRGDRDDGLRLLRWLRRTPLLYRTAGGQSGFGQHALAASGLVVPEAGGDDGDLDLVAETFIEYSAEDDIGVFVGGVLNNGGGLVDLRELERAGTRDVDQDAAGTVDRTGFEQRRGHRGDRSIGSAGGAGTRGSSHHGIAHASHGRLDIGEVTVDDTGDRDDVGDALNALAEHIVGDAETLEETGILGDGKQLLIGNDDKSVDALQQLLHATLGLHHAALAFKTKGPGHHGHGKRSHLAGQRCNDRSGARTGSPAQACRNKDHVCAFKSFDDLLRVFEGGRASDIGIGAGAEPARQLNAELKLNRRIRDLEGLRVGIGDDELDPFDTCGNHAVDGVIAAAADADDLDTGTARHVLVIVDADGIIRAASSGVLRRVRRVLRVLRRQGVKLLRLCPF